LKIAERYRSRFVAIQSALRRMSLSRCFRAIGPDLVGIE